MIGMPSNLLVLKYCDYFVWIHLLSLNKFTSEVILHALSIVNVKKKVRIFLNSYSRNSTEPAEGFPEAVFGF